MKTNKLIALFCVTATLLSFTACNGKNTVEDAPPAETITSMTEVTEENKETESDDTFQYSNTTYTVGTDIPAGTYLITCTDASSCMNVIVFSSETEYKNYDSTEKITGGEFRNAVEINAWVDSYLYPDESLFARLDEGNIIFLDDGMCEFNKYDLSDSNTLYPGVYEIGKDIEGGKVNIDFVSDYPRITLFENGDKYLDYHKTDRLTGGDEDTAIENNSILSNYIYSSESCSIDLEDGMLLFVQGGTVKYSKDDGPVIN